MNDLIDRHLALVNQLRWERDTAIAQLAEIGKGLGERMDDVEKVVRCKDCRWSRGFATFACPMVGRVNLKDNDFCSIGERRKK